VSSLVFTFETGQIAFALPLADPAASALSHSGRCRKLQFLFLEFCDSVFLKSQVGGSQLPRPSHRPVSRSTGRGSGWAMVETARCARSRARLSSTSSAQPHGSPPGLFLPLRGYRVGTDFDVDEKPAGLPAASL